MTAQRLLRVVLPMVLALLVLLPPRPVPVARAAHPTFAPTRGLGDSASPRWAAHSFTVDSTHDAVDATPGDGVCATAAGECTLRAAIQETNALPGADLIVVPDGVYRLKLGELDITDNLIIAGAGPKATIVDGGGLGRVIAIPATANVIIKGLTIRDGNAVATSNSGGGIFNGNATQTASPFLTLLDVTVTGNAATFGGGIMNGWGASMLLRGVTVDNNSAAYGAGLYTRDTGKVDVINSTFSNNTASTGGGGIDTWFNADLSLRNVTIAQNTAVIGAGINREYNTHRVTLESTIVANNSGGDCVGMIVSEGYNVDSDSSCSLTQPTDLPGRQPLLGPLADNGGPTQTMALLAGSPAIDHGGRHATGCPLTDQRGLPRPDEASDNGRCDSGAYESQGIQ